MGPGTLERQGLGIETQLLAGGRGRTSVSRLGGGSRTVEGMEFGTAEESGIRGG